LPAQAEMARLVDVMFSTGTPTFVRPGFVNMSEADLLSAEIST
jgi:hypothetical protein